MNVRGNILIIWQGGSPISKHPHFDTQSPSPLSALPLPSSYPPVSSSHLTPSVSQGPIKSPPPSFTTTPLSFSLSFSQMSPSFFCSYSCCRIPCGWFNFSGHRHHLSCSLCPLWQGMRRPEFVCMSVSWFFCLFGWLVVFFFLWHNFLMQGTKLYYNSN